MCAVTTAPALRLKRLLSFTHHTPAIIILPSPDRARSIDFSICVCMCVCLSFLLILYYSFHIHLFVVWVLVHATVQEWRSVGNSQDLVLSCSMCDGNPTEVVRAWQWPCFVLFCLFFSHFPQYVFV